MESDFKRSLGFPDVYSLEKSAEKQILAGASFHAYPASPGSKKMNLQSDGSVLECLVAQSPYSGLSQLSSASAGTVIYPVCQQLSLAAAQQPRKLDIMIYRKLNLEYSWTRPQRSSLMLRINQNYDSNEMFEHVTFTWKYDFHRCTPLTD